MSKLFSKTTEQFIQDSIKIHKNRYTYDKVDYKNALDKVIVTCIKHGDFKITPNHHLNGNGCPICSYSKGELLIYD